ncbi:MAG: hypothetical protein KC516_03305 [Nanoarchaeota archaeon]|nr:hypothetical protein [Nanoarchaeota archaeon]
MSALEDSTLEEIRGKIGALVLLTQNASGAHYLEFVKVNSMNEVLDYINEGFVDKKGESENVFYSLNDKGWKYAREALNSIGKIL